MVYPIEAKNGTQFFQCTSLLRHTEQFKEYDLKKDSLEDIEIKIGLWKKVFFMRKFSKFRY